MNTYPDEKSLLQAIQNKDENAFRELVEMYKDYVYRICYSFVRHSEDAEDIAQEVFIEIYRSAGNFRSESKISTWIYRIAVNKSINVLKSRQYNFSLKQITSLFKNENQFRAIESDQSDSAEFNVRNSEKNKILYNAIDKLPENQKIAFTLNKIDGMSYQEIASIMGMSLSSVESLIHRAKINLQKKLSWYFKKT